MSAIGKRRRILRFGVAIGAATVAAIGVCTGAQAAGSSASEGRILNAGGADAVANRYIAVYSDSARVASVERGAAQLADRYGGTVRHTYSQVLRGFSVTMSEQRARRLAADPAIASVQQVRTMRVADTQTNPPNWGDDRIDQRDLPLDRSYTYASHGGEGATVYVLDTGIRRTHQDFGGRASYGPDFVDNDNDASDCHGHGTHVAGTAVGSTYGVAKKAKVVAVRILNCQGSGGDDGILKAIDWVAKNAQKPAVVNYSVGCGSPCSNPTMDNAVKNLIGTGVQWVQAAGNSTQDACQYSPQKLPEAITVGATTNTDARSSFSNIGRCLDIFAPGSSIVSASHSSDSGSASMSGTSMASPHTAGAVALYLGAFPNATPAQARDALVDNGTTGKVTSPGTGSPNVLLYTGFIGAGEPGVPVARFTASCSSTEPSCSFDASTSSDSNGSITGYAWEFGDGSKGEGAKPSHTYAEAGSYTVKLTVTDNDGKANSTSKQVTAGSGGGGQPPTARFTANCPWQAPCTFDGSTSSDSDGSITGYAWDFGDTTKGSGATVTHTYPNVTATYTAKLTVTDNSRLTASTQKQVHCYQGFGSNAPFCFVQ
jgi:subtilisin family serine protease/chitodextrinase